MKPGDLVSVSRCYSSDKHRMVDVDMEFYTNNIAEAGQLGLVLSTANLFDNKWVLLVTCHAIGWLEECAVTCVDHQ